MFRGESSGLGLCEKHPAESGLSLRTLHKNGWRQFHSSKRPLQPQVLAAGNPEAIVEVYPASHPAGGMWGMNARKLLGHLVGLQEVLLFQKHPPQTLAPNKPLLQQNVWKTSFFFLLLSWRQNFQSVDSLKANCVRVVNCQDSPANHHQTATLPTCKAPATPRLGAGLAAEATNSDHFKRPP